MSLTLGNYKQYFANIARCAVVGLAFVIPLSNTATSILGLVFLLTCVVSLTKAQIKTIITHPVTKVICLLFALYLIGAIYSEASTQNVNQALRKYVRLLLIPLIMPFFADPKWRSYSLLAFIAAVFISVVAAIFAQIPVFKDNIFTSLFVAVASFILCHYCLLYPKFKWLIISGIALLLYYLYFVSIGRTGQVLFIILYTIFCWQSFAKNIKLQAVAAVLLSLLLAVSIMLPSTFMMRQKIAAQEVKTYLDDTNASVATSSLGSRLTFARNAIGLIKERPLIGWGTGSFATAYRLQYPETVANNSATVNPHNQYLLTGVELGIPGILVLIALFAVILINFHRLRNIDARIGFGVVCAVACGCLANSWLMDFASMFFFVVLTGILLAASD